QAVSINNIEVKGLVLHTETAIYDVDMLTRRSQPLQDTVHASSDCLFLNSIEANKFKLANAMPVTVTQGDYSVELFVNIDDAIPNGSVFAYKCVGLRSDVLTVQITGAGS
ncbi:MAG: hypothetical protein L3J53_05150, partial [Proteobacteria bacterium]|nr:hypothetical protein [Pseudomonadota bacterium]